MKKYKIKTAVYRDESRLFYAAALSFIVVFMTYVYFLSSSIVNVVMRKEVDTQISSLGTHVSTLEEKYIEMQHSVSSDIATMKGYVVADKKVFIDKGEDTLVMSRN
jgi:hypothetical protein